MHNFLVLEGSGLVGKALISEEVTVYPKLFCNINTHVIITKQLSYIIGHNLKGIFHLASEDVKIH